MFGQVFKWLAMVTFTGIMFYYTAWQVMDPQTKAMFQWVIDLAPTCLFCAYAAYGLCIVLFAVAFVLKELFGSGVNSLRLRKACIAVPYHSGSEARSKTDLLLSQPGPVRAQSTKEE